MKRICVVLLVLVLAVGVVACGQKPVEPVDGYAMFQDESLGLRVQYPATWVELGANDVDNPEMVQMMQELMGADEAQVRQMMQVILVYFFDRDNATEMFVPNMNVVTEQAGGTSQRAFTSDASVAEFKTAVESQYNNMFPDFSWVLEPQAQEHGNNTFIVCTSQYSIQGIEVVVRQAITTNGKRAFTFTYSIPAQADDMTETWETILRTVQFS